MTGDTSAPVGVQRASRPPLGRPGPTWRGDGALGGPLPAARPSPVRTTPEGRMAALGLAVAPVRLRVLAYLVDYMLLAVITSVALALAGTEPATTLDAVIAQGREHAPEIIVLEVLFRWPWNAIGWSPGKRLAGLRTVNAEGAPPGPWRGLGRSVGALASELPLLPGYVWAVFDRERRTWHDHIAGTWVIRSPRDGQPRR